GDALGIPPVHEPGHVLEADVARLQLLMIERAEAAPSNLLMPFKGEIHFFNAVAFGARAELGFGAGRAAAEEDAVRWFHKRCAAKSDDLGCGVSLWCHRHPRLGNR